LDDRHYCKLVVEYLEKFGQASREDIDGFLLAKLGDALNPKQKQTKIGNLLTGTRKEGLIHNTGSRGKPCWRLAKKE
jgi:ATP-dependent DNA helicase RecG